MMYLEQLVKHYRSADRGSLIELAGLKSDNTYRIKHCSGSTLTLATGEGNQETEKSGLIAKMKKEGLCAALPATGLIKNYKSGHDFQITLTLAKDSELQASIIEATELDDWVDITATADVAEVTPIQRPASSVFSSIMSWWNSSTVTPKSSEDDDSGNQPGGGPHVSS